ncbi:MAG: hypothetical protein R3F37_03940 [Candidatus Competibacteraceae bacterium]
MDRQDNEIGYLIAIETGDNTMKAMIITAFGGPEVFVERDVPKPEPGVTEVLVRVHASSVNPVDYKIRQAGSWAGSATGDYRLRCRQPSQLSAPA